LFSKIFLVLILVIALSTAATTFAPVLAVSNSATPAAIVSTSTEATVIAVSSEIEPAVFQGAPELPIVHTTSDPYHDVPFYSQFADITPVEWRKVGCGIASVAMLIDFYSSEIVDVDSLLLAGIKSNAYLDDAGWTHNGLIDLSKQFNLDGASYSLSHLTMESAFMALEGVVKEGPVMVSVHYTFKPTNPIPHLAVVTGIDNERVYYNDPAEAVGQNSISIEQFQSAWKKRYIEIRPAA